MDDETDFDATHDHATPPAGSEPPDAVVKIAYLDFVSLLVHRVLAGHQPWQDCPECLAICHHCGDVGKPGDDHTCPCPYSDPCPRHPSLRELLDHGDIHPNAHRANDCWCGVSHRREDFL